MTHFKPDAIVVLDLFLASFAVFSRVGFIFFNHLGELSLLLQNLLLEFSIFLFFQSHLKNLLFGILNDFFI